MSDEPEVVYVERGGGGGLKWLLLGAVLGAGAALLFAPKSGRELRRDLGKGIRGLRDLADETLDEFRHEGPNQEHELHPESGREVEPARRRKPERPSMVTAREELERRLAAARARRRQPVPEDEEPVA
jgi:Sec-independent protein translocase protein TatA